MGVAEKLLDGITQAIRINDKVEGMAGTLKEQQAKIEDLTARVIRLETALEFAMVARGGHSPAPPRQIRHKGKG